jgi:hypothetical protein
MISNLLEPLRSRFRSRMVARPADGMIPRPAQSSYREALDSGGARAQKLSQSSGPPPQGWRPMVEIARGGNAEITITLRVRQPNAASTYLLVSWMFHHFGETLSTIW